MDRWLGARDEAMATTGALESDLAGVEGRERVMDKLMTGLETTETTALEEARGQLESLRREMSKLQGEVNSLRVWFVHGADVQNNLTIASNRIVSDKKGPRAQVAASAGVETDNEAIWARLADVGGRLRRAQTCEGHLAQSLASTVNTVLGSVTYTAAVDGVRVLRDYLGKSARGVEDRRLSENRVVLEAAMLETAQPGIDVCRRNIDQAHGRSWS